MHSINMSHCSVIDWQGSGDHGSWLSLKGFAINPFQYSLQLHNITSSFYSLSPSCFSWFLFLYTTPLPLTQCQLVLHLPLFLSQSQEHARQIDGALIANVMMLQSTYLTCLINTTAATSALFSLSYSDTHRHAHTHSCTQLRAVMHSSNSVSLPASAFSSASLHTLQSRSFLSAVKHRLVKLTWYTVLHTNLCREKSLLPQIMSNVYSGWLLFCISRFKSISWT